MTAARKQRRKATAMLLAVLAAAGLGAASFGNRWLTTQDDKAGMGLRTVEICDDNNDHCFAMSNFDLIDLIEERIVDTREANALLPPNQQVPLPRPPWHGFPVMGMIAMIAALIAAVGLLVAAAVAAAGKRPAVPIMPTTVAVLGLLIALVTGCIFVATKPDASTSMVVGWTFMVFGGGIVTGLAAVFPLNRAIRPIDDDLGEASSTMSWGESRDDAP